MRWFGVSLVQLAARCSALRQATNLPRGLGRRDYAALSVLVLRIIRTLHSRLASVLTGRPNNDVAVTKLYLCPVCGRIELGAPPESCPIYGAKGNRFVTV